MRKEFLRRIGDVFDLIRSGWLSHKETFGQTEIRGSRIFCEKVKAALTLLKEKDAENCDVVNKNLLLIIQGVTTSLSPGMPDSGLMLGKGESFQSSITWLAGLLVYEAYRAQLYKDYKDQHKGVFKIPEDAYSGNKAYEFHYNCLRRIGASYEELEHLSRFIAKQNSPKS